MGLIPPPVPLSRKEFNDRIKAGARTMAEIDPALYQYCKLSFFPSIKNLLMLKRLREKKIC
jgi:hypothetical protein